MALLRHELAALEQIIDVAEARVHKCGVLLLVLTLLVEYFADTDQLAFHLAQDYLHLGLRLTNRSACLQHTILRLTSHAKAAIFVGGLLVPPGTLNPTILPQLIRCRLSIEFDEVLVWHSFLLVVGIFNVIA